MVRTFCPTGFEMRPCSLKVFGDTGSREFTGRPVVAILLTKKEGQGEVSRFDKGRENDSKRSTAGVRIDIKSPRSERGGSDLEKKILESLPKGDSLKWPIELPKK